LEDKETKAKLTLLRGIMPIKNASKYTIPTPIGATDAAKVEAKNELIDFLSVYDEGLYKNAEDFFLTDKDSDKAIILEINNQQIKDYLDKKKDDFPFINKRNPEAK